VLPEPDLSAKPAPTSTPTTTVAQVSAPSTPDAGSADKSAKAAAPAPAPQEAPPLTLEDVGALTPESDFKPFVSPAVQPEVRNAAMKKLFADPHYNVMDGLDIYIDDYSVPSPLPESVLRQMASAKFLQMFEDEDPPAGEVPQGRDNAATAIPADTAHLPSPEPHHDDPDLRLQQDDAAGPGGSGRSTE
jgi:hypothetical protein